MDRGELTAYWDAAESALSAARDLDDTSAEAIFLQMAAFVDTCEGRPELAIEKLDPMLRRMRERKIGYALPLVVVWLARAETQVGALAQARDRLERLVKRGLDGGYILAFALGVLSEVMLLEGDPAVSGVIEQGLAVARRLDSPAALYGPCICAARVAVDSGDWAEAEQLVHEMLTLFTARKLVIETPDVLDVLGEVAAGLGSHEEAARLIGAIDRTRNELGLPVLRAWGPRRDALLASVRAALGDEAFASARAEGETMNLEDALAYVRRARGERKRPPGGWEALTPTELQVVELAREGLTNAAIGERMFISAATVKVHLAHIYAKLNVPNRAALATAAAARRAPTA
jgi:ATP/maltotriose-dependent transcriptional regulator MalT